MSLPRPGDRIALVHTDDPHTCLQPGSLGTVVRASAERVDVAWDDGSSLSLLPNEGDRYERVEQ